MLDIVSGLAPILAALATAVVPLVRLLRERPRQQQLRDNLTALAALQDKLPPDQRNAVGREMREHLDDLSAEMHYRRVRRFDASTIALMVVVNALAIGFAVPAYLLEHWIARTIFAVIAAALFGFSLIGLGELYEMPEGDDRVPARLRKRTEKAKA